MQKLFDFVYRIGFYVFFIAMFAGLYLLMTGSAAYTKVVMAGSVVSAILLFCCVYEVASYKTAKRSDKVSWIVGFCFFNILAALVYIAFQRRKLLNTN